MAVVKQTPSERIEWYSRAHSHSLGAIMTPAHDYANVNGFDGLASLIRSSNRIIQSTLQDIWDSDDPEGDLEAIIPCFKAVEEDIDALPDPHKQVLRKSIFDGRRTIAELRSVIEDPDYEDSIQLLPFAREAFTDAAGPRTPKYLLVRYSSSEQGPRKKHLFSPRDAYLLFENLINNAVQAMDSGTISVNVIHHPEKGYATYVVENTGSYISEEHLAQINARQRFSTKGDLEEHGKGLQFVYDIARGYGGRLRVSSSQEAMTTRFEVDLPYDRHRLVLLDPNTYANLPKKEVKYA